MSIRDQQPDDEQLAANDAGISSQRAKAKNAVARGDFESARVLYHELAEIGDRSSYLALGMIYERGLKHGVDQDLKASRHWYERAFNEGKLAVAAMALAKMHYLGQGGDVDYRNAFFYCSKLNADTHPGALLLLGIMHEKGNGVAQNVRQARIYYRRAASKCVFALKNWAVLEVKRGNPLGFLLWGVAFLQTWWLLTFKPNDDRLKMI